MFGRPILMFKCTFRPLGGTREDDFEVPLIFFSAFSRTNLTPNHVMQRRLEAIQLYEPGPYPSKDPILHVGFLSNVLCRAPLMPCFVHGCSTPTIPYSLRRLQRSQFPNGKADSQPGKGDGRKLYEVNDWLWKFGRGMPRKVTVAEAERIRSSARAECKSRGWNTRKRPAARTDHSDDH